LSKVSLDRCHDMCSEGEGVFHLRHATTVPSSLPHPREMAARIVGQPARLAVELHLLKSISLAI
jgi:hypothetical protein